MKKPIFLFAAAIAFLFTACGTDNSSRTVAEKFLKAYSSHKYDEAKQYTTGKTQKMVEIAGHISKTAPKLKNAEYEILECNEFGDKASVKYQVKGTDNTEVIYLVKENETWLVGNKE